MPETKNTKFSWLTLIFIIAATLLVGDVFLKKYFYLNQNLNLNLGNINFHFTLNQDLSWGLKIFNQPTIIILSVIVTITILYFLALSARKEKISYCLFLSLLFVGAVSNLYDRFFYGGVADYIDLSWWPVFNLADITITIGTIGLVVLLLRQKN